MTDISGKWAVVTGGSSGIGLAFAETLAGMHANLLLISIQPEELAQQRQRLGTTYGVDVRTLLLDLTAPGAAAAVVRFMEENAIVPHIFINNAGIFSFAPVTATSESRINAFIDLHVRAVTELSRAVAIIMSQRPEGGYILNMSSLACWTPMPGLAMYSATKAYIRTFSRALAYEVRESGVRVLACCPGGIATNLFGLPERLMRLAVALHFVTTPETFARKAVNRLLKGRRQYINGLINRLLIALVGVAPTSVRMLIKHKMLDKGIVKP
jgi:hypothetical protein